MQRPPLQVDTVTSVWDVLQTLADMVAGVGAAGALLIAALVYRRQVSSENRSQASKVTARLELDDKNESAVNLVVVNASDQEVFLQDYRAYDNGEAVTGWEVLDRRRVAFFTRAVPTGIKFIDSVEHLSVELKFRDAAGNEWVRGSSGSLLPMTQIRVPRWMGWLRFFSRRFYTWE